MGMIACNLRGVNREDFGEVPHILLRHSPILVYTPRGAHVENQADEEVVLYYQINYTLTDVSGDAAYLASGCIGGTLWIRSRPEGDHSSSGMASGWRYLPLQDDIASTAFWYQAEPHAQFPGLPGRDALEVI